MSNRQCQSTEGMVNWIKIKYIFTFIIINTILFTGLFSLHANLKQTSYVVPIYDVPGFTFLPF